MDNKSFLEEYLNAAGVQAYVVDGMLPDLVTEVSARIPFLPLFMFDASYPIGDVLPMRCEGYRIGFTLPEIWHRLEAVGTEVVAHETSRFIATTESMTITIIEPGVMEVYFGGELVMLLATSVTCISDRPEDWTIGLDPKNDLNVARTIADSYLTESLTVLDPDNSRIKRILGMYNPIDVSCFQVPVCSQSINKALQDRERWNKWLVSNLVKLLGVNVEMEQPQVKKTSSSTCGFCAEN